MVFISFDNKPLLRCHCFFGTTSELPCMIRVASAVNLFAFLGYQRKKNYEIQSHITYKKPYLIVVSCYMSILKQASLFFACEKSYWSYLNSGEQLYLPRWGLHTVFGKTNRRRFSIIDQYRHLKITLAHQSFCSH